MDAGEWMWMNGSSGCRFGSDLPLSRFAWCGYNKLNNRGGVGLGISFKFPFPCLVNVYNIHATLEIDEIGATAFRQHDSNRLDVMHV